MQAGPEKTFEEQIKSIGQVRKEELPEVIAELRLVIDEQRKREQTIERIAAERRAFVREHGIDSELQHKMDMEP